MAQKSEKTQALRENNIIKAGSTTSRKKQNEWIHKTNQLLAKTTQMDEVFQPMSPQGFVDYACIDTFCGYT